MASFTLTNLAKADLREIGRYTQTPMNGISALQLIFL